MPANEDQSQTDKSVNAVIDQDIYELKGLINMKMIEVDVKLMREAFEMETRKQTADDDNVWASTGSTTTTDEGSNEEINAITNSTFQLKLDKNRMCEHFSGLPIKIPEITSSKEISNFDTARTVYLRAITKIEESKQIFPLDGHVTNYVSLLISHSKLYHYLAIFEKDLKRKFTMENRRIDMLTPLLYTLSRSAFEGLHKNVRIA